MPDEPIDAVRLTAIAKAFGYGGLATACFFLGYNPVSEKLQYPHVVWTSGSTVVVAFVWLASIGFLGLMVRAIRQAIAGDPGKAAEKAAFEASRPIPTLGKIVVGPFSFLVGCGLVYSAYFNSEVMSDVSAYESAPPCSPEQLAASVPADCRARMTAEVVGRNAVEDSSRRSSRYYLRFRLPSSNRLVRVEVDGNRYRNLVVGKTAMIEVWQQQIPNFINGDELSGNALDATYDHPARHRSLKLVMGLALGVVGATTLAVAGSLYRRRQRFLAGRARPTPTP